MKNASCKKLSIDRSKSKKVGTLKDISLFVNFTFPTEGELEGGLIMRSLAGVGTTIRKTRGQIKHLSGRQVPIAGATGATISDDQPAPEPIVSFFFVITPRELCYTIYPTLPCAAIIFIIESYRCWSLFFTEARNGLCLETWPWKKDYFQPS